MIDCPQGIVNITGQIILTGTYPLKCIIHNVVKITSLQYEQIKINISGELCHTLKLKLKLSGSTEALITL
ncbi:hypothetical protein [Candidatus Erwinia haradaeae]|uniref:hypothetical protein n=1 Tax=Candidatus Erwinia haradaeae TaxID=1922217 RepID=UPI001390371D|nr:hypothetical protein [Candidatus Erwinia haradaeae]